MSTLITSVLVVHWLGDFVIQTDWQAKNKSKSWNALLRHIATYTFTLLILWPVCGLTYVLAQGALHLLTDYFTSRLNKWLFETHGSHNFFIGVGLDQLIHTLTLLWLLP